MRMNMLNNKYLLAIMIAKRAKELRKGAKPLVVTKSRLPMKIALEEVGGNQIQAAYENCLRRGKSRKSVP
jgi:DNA-directed RNA polymerase subunit K/omega